MSAFKRILRHCGVRSGHPLPGSGGSDSAETETDPKALEARYPLRLSDAFVPGKMRVRFEDQAIAGTIARLAGDAGDVSAMGLIATAQASGQQRLLRRADTVDKDTLFSNLGIREALARSTAPETMDTATRAKLETLWMVRALARQSGVQSAEPNYIRQPFTVPDDPHYTYQWHYPLINLPDAWDITTGSSNVVVAVIVTGVLLDYPDLSGQRLDGDDFISDTDISLDGDGYICEDGEACESYLSLDQPATITINTDIENIDFTTDINLNLSTESQSSTLPLPLYLETE